MQTTITRQSLEEFLKTGQKWQVTFLTGDKENPGLTCYSNSIFANVVDYINGVDEGLSDAVVFANQCKDELVAEVIIAIDNLIEIFRDENTLVCTYPYLEIQVPGMDPYPYIVIEKKA